MTLTVADLIRDLQTMPRHLPVHILPASCTACDESGEFDVYFDDANSVQANDVRFGGAFVLITGRE